jgi:hypothetical protein
MVAATDNFIKRLDLIATSSNEKLSLGGAVAPRRLPRRLQAVVASFDADQPVAGG